MNESFPPPTSSVPTTVRSSFAIRHWLAFLQILAAPALCSLSLSAAQQTFTWTNPVTGGPDWIRDAYIKNPNNPIWGASQPRWREAAGQPAKLPFTEVGHGTPFLGPDGRLWVSGHGHVMQGGALPPYDSPRLCLDPLNFDFKTGEFSSALSWNPQTISFHPASPAARRARSEPMGSVLEQYGKP